MTRPLIPPFVTSIPLADGSPGSSRGNHLRGTRQRLAAIRWSPTAAIVLAAVLVACSHAALSDTSGDAGRLPDACEQYLGTYATCMKTIGQKPDVVDERIASARRTLAASSSGADALSARCAANTHLLSTACR
jgi:hypothetical protein